MKRLEGRVAVITGAASGIGRALAESLAARGCRLALCDVDADGLGETLRRVRSAGVTASRHLVDVADREAMAGLPEAVIAEHGGVHLLVNNAGVAVMDRVEDMSLEDFDWIVGVNFWGVVHGCKFFLPHLLAADEAHIVNLSSIFGIIGLPTQSAYCATKFAVRGFSEALHAELAPTRVGLTIVHPGGVNTNIVRSSRTRDEAARQRAIENFDRRAMTPERAAAAILRAVERGRLRCVFTREAVIGDLLKRCFPTGLHRLVALVVRRRGVELRGG